MSALTPDGYRFATLDGMRGVGSILVLIGHGWPGTFPSGYAAIDMFFLHSGFILAYTSQGRVDDPSFTRSFITSRVIRLLPLYFAGMAFGAIVCVVMNLRGYLDWSTLDLVYSIVLSIFMLPYLGGHPYGVYPINPVAWSLFFEFIVNFAATYTRFRLRPSIVIWLVSLPFLIYCYQLWLAAGGSMTEDFVGGFARVFYSFFAGVIVFHLSRSKWALPISLPWWVCLAILLLMYTPNFEGNIYIGFMVIVAQPFIFFVFASSRMSGRPAEIAIWLGLISYALYVVHFPMQLTGYVFSRVLSRLFEFDLPVWVGSLIAAPVSLIAAHLLTFYYDVPVRAFLRGLVKKRGTRAQVASS